MRWKYSPFSEHHWHHWDGEKFLIFNASSAQTHQLNLFAADIIFVLKDRPLDFSELSRQLIDIYEGLEFDTEVAKYLQETLGFLDDLGLIQPELMWNSQNLYTPLIESSFLFKDSVLELVLSTFGYIVT